MDFFVVFAEQKSHFYHSKLQNWSYFQISWTDKTLSVLVFVCISAMLELLSRNLVAALDKHGLFQAL